jgi:two-component system cell cycle response regulator
MTLSSEHSLTDERPLPILIAEENAATRLTLCELTSQWGYRAIPVQNGAQVLQKLGEKGAPQIAIVSNSLRDCSGIALCRKIRETRLAHYPYLLLTSDHNDKNELVLASEAGADDYLAKPLDNAVLKARLAVARRIHALQQRWIAAGEELRMRAALDELTGLWNRASLLDLLTRELDRARTSHLQTGLLMLDLDHFKSINDTYGHQAGDAVLREAARRIRLSVRSYDFVGRYGGEEFCIVMPGCSDAQVRRRAEMIRLAVSSEPFRIGAALIPLTVSVGATVVPPTEFSLSAVLSRADVALYHAKASGRNITVHCARSAAEFKFEMKSFSIHCAECPRSYSSLCVVQRLAPDVVLLRDEKTRFGATAAEQRFGAVR